MKRLLFLFLMLAAYGNSFAQEEYNPGTLGFDNQRAYARMVTNLKNSFSDNQKEQLQEFIELYPSLYEATMMLGMRMEGTFLKILNDSSFIFAESIDDALQGHSERTVQQVKEYYTDFFSLEPDIPLYIPLYDRETEKIVSFLLLSTGIDGKIDNKLEKGEKLYTDEWRQKIKAYNMKSFLEYEKKTGQKAEHFPGGMHYIDVPPLDISALLWGDKDLIISVGSDTINVDMDYKNGTLDYKRAKYLKK